MTDAINSVLSQIRAFQTQVQRPAAPAAMPNGTAPVARASFAETLTSAVKSVNETQMESGRLRQAFELGDPRADLARVMVAAQQSQVAFRATVEVRNRLVQAYQDVMNMPL